MVKLQHERNRGPGQFVNVNGTKYELDAEGNIEVSEADAEKLLLGSKWRPPAYWDARRDKIAAATPPPAPAGVGRRVRTRAELMATAEANGVPVEEAKAEAPQKAIPAPAPAPEPIEAELEQEETVTVSDEMTKSELLALAADCGIKANRGMSKGTILSLFEDEA